MKLFNKLVFALIAALCCVSAMCANSGTESSEEKMATFSNDEITLSIPEKYKAFFSVEAPTNSDYLFIVYDKEAAAKGLMSENYPDAVGLLLMIDVITEEEYHKLLCDSFDFEVFSKDGNGHYYVMYYPNYHYSVSDYINFEIAFLDCYPFLDNIRQAYSKNWINGTENAAKFEAVE